MHRKDFFSEALVEPNSNCIRLRSIYCTTASLQTGAGVKENNIYVLLTPNGRLKI
jgi:hypothetical protein